MRVTHKVNCKSEIYSNLNSNILNCRFNLFSNPSRCLRKSIYIVVTRRCKRVESFLWTQITLRIPSSYNAMFVNSCFEWSTAVLEMNVLYVTYILQLRLLRRLQVIQMGGGGGRGWKWNPFYSTSTFNVQTLPTTQNKLNHFARTVVCFEWHNLGYIYA
jgi:hypothetical protein